MAIASVQTRYRFRTDTLTVDTASPVWGAAENTTYLPTPIQLGTPFRLRFEVQNTGTTTTGAATWEIYYSRNAGAYTAVTASSTHVQSSTAANTIDADDTSLATRRLTSDTGTYTNGRYDSTGQVASGLVTMAASSVTEFEFGLVLTNACRTGDTIDLQMRRNGATTTFTFTVTPRITVSQASLVGGLACGGSDVAKTAPPALRKALATAGIASAASVMGLPPIAKTTILSPTVISYGAYTADQITVGINYGLTGGLACGSSSLGQPSLSIAGGTTYTISVTTVSYTFKVADQLTTDISYALIGGLACGASSLGQPTLGQKHVLATTALATVASSMGQPTLTVGGGISSVSIATRSAGLGLGNNLVPAFPS